MHMIGSDGPLFMLGCHTISEKGFKRGTGGTSLDSGCSRGFLVRPPTWGCGGFLGSPQNSGCGGFLGRVLNLGSTGGLGVLLSSGCCGGF